MNKKDLENKEIYHKGGRNGILILHGFTSTLEQTDTLFKYLIKKDFTVARPMLKGHTRKVDDFVKYGPDDWLFDAKSWVDCMHKEVDNLFLITISFGGNLGVSICADKNYNKKVKGAIFLEMPIFFKLRIAFFIYIIPFVCSILGIKSLKKRKLFYRKGFENKDNTKIPFLPTKATAQVRNFIKHKTRKKLKECKTPCLLVSSIKSDLLTDKNAEYIFKNIGSERKELSYANIENHDLNLLDDEGRILMMKKINNFINKINK